MKIKPLTRLRELIAAALKSQANLSKFRTKAITSSSYTLSIHDRNANYGSGYVENDIFYAEMDWLKAELDMRTGMITVTAEKNNTGKKRTLYISGMYADIQSSIPVIQE